MAETDTPTSIQVLSSRRTGRIRARRTGGIVNKGLFGFVVSGVCLSLEFSFRNDFYSFIRYVRQNATKVGSGATSWSR